MIIRTSATGLPLSTGIFLLECSKASGLVTDWVMNITDVGHLVSDADEGQDKIEKGAEREGKNGLANSIFLCRLFY